MGFATVDSLYNAISENMQTLTVPFTRTVKTGATTAAYRWHEALTGDGTGGSMVLTDSNPGSGIVMTSGTVGALPIGADVEPSMTKHLLSMYLSTSISTIVPAVVMLTDIIHIYPSCALKTTPSTLSNHPVWTGSGDTRMTSAKGVQASVMLTTATSSPIGQITLTYKDQDGNSQAQIGSLWSTNATGPIGSCYIQAGATATNIYGSPLTALASGDYGIQEVTSYAINASPTAAAVGAIVLHRPICTIPLTQENVPVERDFTTGPIRLPRIYDGACLGLLVQVGGSMATTTSNNIIGELVYGWD